MRRWPSVLAGTGKPTARVVAYYDADEITPAAIAAVESAAGAGHVVLHVRRADVGWPVEASFRGDVVTVPSHRDPEFLADLVRELERVGKAQDDPELIDVALYEWVYAAAPAAHRPWVAARIMASHRPERLLWVTSEVVGGLSRAVRCWSGVGEVLPVGAAAARPSFKRRISRALRLRRAQVAVNRVRRSILDALGGAMRPLVRRESLVLVDQYAHTARLLADVGRVASSGTGVRALAIGTDARVAAACQPFVDSVSLPDLAPRRVRGRAAVAAAKAGRLAAAAVSESQVFGAAAGSVPGFASASRDAVAGAARHRVLVEDAITRTAPRALATTSIVASSARAAALVGRARGIPCAWVQHGILRTDEWKTRYVQSHFLCWGERDRRKLIAAGVVHDAVVVTGSSQFEDLGARARAGAGSAAHAEGLRVLYLPSRSGGNLVSLPVAEAMVEGVAAAVRALPGASLTVKPHPGDTSSVFEDLGDGVVVARGAELVASVLAADVVVVATSTAGLEACALDRPVVALAFAGTEVADEYADYGAALVAHGPGEIGTALVALADPVVADQLAAGRRAMVDDLFDGLRPGSARRCAAELVRLAGGGEVPAERVAFAWYEADAIAPAHVAAVAAAGGAELHVHSADARWNADIDAKHESLPGWRDPAWRDELGDIVDRAMPLLADRLAPASVLEAARYDWFHRLAPVAHRAWVLQELLDRGATEVLWVTDGPPPSNLAAALRAAAAGRATVRVLTPSPFFVGNGGTMPRLSTKNGVGNRVRAKVGRVRRAATAQARLFTTATSTPPAPGCALFIEAYPRGATVSATVARHVAESVPAHCITTSAAITGDGALAVLSPVSLDIAASRRARLRANRRSRAVRANVNAAAELLTDPSTSPWGKAAPALAAGLASSLQSVADAESTATLVDDVVTRWQPAVVVSSTGAPAIVRAGAAAAAGAGIASVFVQHGLLLLYRYRRHLCHTTFVVWGPADRRQLEEAGVTTESIHVCGPPQFDDLAARRAAAEPVEHEEFRVLYLPSRTGGRFVNEEQAAAMLNQVVEALPPSAELRIKPHPSDKTSLFDAIDDDPSCRVVRGVDPLDEILDADAVVIATSTVGIEAVALGLPVIVLRMNGVEVPEELVGYDATTVVSSAAELTAALVDIRDGGAAGAAARAALVEDLLAGLRPGAAERAAEVITAAATDVSRVRR